KFHTLAESTTPKARHSVSTRRIDDMPEIGNVDLFKIDVQGAELSVFQNALRALSRTLVIRTEVEFVEMYRGQPLFADVDRLLRGRGFQFHTFPGFGSRAFKPLALKGEPNKGVRQFLWSDAIYVRDWMRLDELEAAKLRKYAILTHDVVESEDLTHL